MPLACSSARSLVQVLVVLTEGGREDSQARQPLRFRRYRGRYPRRKRGPRPTTGIRALLPSSTVRSARRGTRPPQLACPAEIAEAVREADRVLPPAQTHTCTRQGSTAVTSARSPRRAQVESMGSSEALSRVLEPKNYEQSSLEVKTRRFRQKSNHNITDQDFQIRGSSNYKQLRRDWERM